MEITYGSVCSGIEAATLAWKPLGMRATWFAEIEAFPSAVLAHHYPNTPNLGDMTKLGAQVLAGKIAAPDILVGGTPCQAFSVAGMREGLTDPRGALTIKYVELADAVDYVRAVQRKPACVIVWENVPGVLSDKGNAFGCFLGALAGEDSELHPSGKRWADAGCVYGPKRTIAWRILDAQYFGLAQRRRRVFVVASAREGFDPTSVLFERDGLRRDSPPRRGEIKAAAALTANGAGTCGADDNQAQAGHLIAFPIQNATRGKSQNGIGIAGPADAMYTLDNGSQHAVCVTGDVTHCLKADGFDGSEDDTGRGQPIVTHAIQAGALRTNPASGPDGVGVQADHAYTLEARAEVQAVQSGSAVRRLTPAECERLQGFPDSHTQIPWRKKPADECPDGPRYKAIGNSKAVPVVRWIGKRLLAALQMEH